MIYIMMSGSPTTDIRLGGVVWTKPWLFIASNHGCPMARQFAKRKYNINLTESLWIELGKEKGPVSEGKKLSK